MLGAAFDRILGGGKAKTEQLFEQQTIFGEQQGFERQLAQLISDPSSVTQDPGYQFGLSQGLQGVERQYGAMGLGKSGGAGSALYSFGQDYATSTWMQQVQMLAALSGLTSTNTAAMGATASQPSALTSIIQSFLGGMGQGMGGKAAMGMF